MTDIMQSALLFEASSKLQSAATWLGRMANGEEPDEAGKQLLQWAGAFLARVDDSDLSVPDSYGLGAQATNAKPAFYASLLRFRKELEQNDVTTSAKLTSFLSALQSVLISGKASEPAESIRLAAKLLQAVSKGLLLQAEQPYSARDDDFSATG